MLRSPERAVRHEEARQARRALLTEDRRGGREGLVELPLGLVDEADDAVAQLCGQATEGALVERRHQNRSSPAYVVASGMAVTRESSRAKNASSLGPAAEVVAPTERPPNESRMDWSSPECWFCLRVARAGLRREFACQRQCMLEQLKRDALDD